MEAKTGGYRTLSFRKNERIAIDPKLNFYNSKQDNYLIALVDTPKMPGELVKGVTNYAVVCIEKDINNLYSYVGLGDYEKEYLGTCLNNAIEQGYKPNTWVNLILYYEETIDSEIRKAD